MSSPKKVAVLVHNDVLHDARVRKQARTLLEAGHQVEVFGFSRSKNGYPAMIEGGARLSIAQEPRRNALIMIALGLRSLLIGDSVAKILLAVLILTALNSLVLAVVLSTLFASWLVPVFVALIGVFVLAALLGVGVFALKRQYVEDWIKIHWSYGAIAKSLARNVKAGGYDVIHCHDIIAMMAGRMIKKENPNITMVWDAHELYTELSYKTPYMSRFIEDVITQISPYVDKMVTISESFVGFYAEQYPKLPKAEVVMNATRRPLTSDLNRQLLREAAGVQCAQKILLFQGGTARFRGVEMLLEAAPRLPANWSVVFMGSGPLQDKIDAAAKHANAARPAGAPCIASVPPAAQEVLRDWTSGADLGIIPYENTSKNHLYCTPNKLWEYPNARVPILATDLVEMKKIITANGTGSLLPREFTSGDIVSAVEAVTDAQLKEWRANCDVFSETENWEKFEPNLLKVYA